ncbi:MAG TPA: hypothetical protein VJB96_03815, partial [Patescibacteria group bacterium]|nr:hypothetical protein [Patescibacteria group bacterium]
MKYQEKKYRVDSLLPIQKLLERVGAKKGQEITTTHYYAEQHTNDIVKLVVYGDRNEIHVLLESHGTYSLKENIPVASVEAGLSWLKAHGYHTVDIVKMAYTDYEYKGGIIGLYVIDNFLSSVILDFPPGTHEAMEKEFGLQNAEVIHLPYN